MGVIGEQYSAEAEPGIKNVVAIIATTSINSLIALANYVVESKAATIASSFNHNDFRRMLGDIFPGDPGYRRTGTHFDSTYTKR